MFECECVYLYRHTRPLHAVNCTPAVKHNTLIFRTARGRKAAAWEVVWWARTLCSDIKCDVLWGWIMLMGLGSRSLRRLKSLHGNQQFDCLTSNYNTSPQSLCLHGVTHIHCLIYSFSHVLRTFEASSRSWQSSRFVNPVEKAQLVISLFHRTFFQMHSSLSICSSSNFSYVFL